MNRLAKATSPYLLAHAHNPVDWYEWGPEALEQAIRQDKPLLLSIGYSACHWCHVMERESFEDPATAEVMNKYFICIKIDREERPDLDNVYMSAVQTLTGRGGWPMTMFCTPDGLPFYGGTYFPPADNHGLPSFTKVLRAVADAWRTQREELLRQGGALQSRIAAMATFPAGSSTLSKETLDAAFAAIRAAHDPAWGGFGGAPKFPQAMTLEFVLRMARIPSKRDDALRMLETSLDRMARGGIFDQIGGGFARYSVDNRWHVPHFEKMLYDNAQLLKLYARASIVLPGKGYEDVAIQTGEFLLREMRQSEGGFSSSLDADSEGVEGKFYVWSVDEIRNICGPDAPAAIEAFDVSAQGNWEGTNVLWNPTNARLDPDQLTRIRSALFDVRSKRIRPATDDKVLASWNGLAISAFAESGRLLRRADFIDAAARAARFVHDAMRDEQGRLQRSYRDGRCSGPGFLDDYALLGNALLDLYETTFDESYYSRAQRCAHEMLTLFSDPNGGFLDTGNDQPSLVIRPKDLYDNAMPCGSSVAARLLGRLHGLTGENSLRTVAGTAIAAVDQGMRSAPLGFGSWLCALDDATAPLQQIAIASQGDTTAQEMIDLVWSSVCVPLVLAGGDPAHTAVPLLRDKSAPVTTAYVCEEFSCKQPVTNAASLAAMLG